MAAAAAAAASNSNGNGNTPRPTIPAKRRGFSQSSSNDDRDDRRMSIVNANNNSMGEDRRMSIVNISTVPGPGPGSVGPSQHSPSPNNPGDVMNSLGNILHSPIDAMQQQQLPTFSEEVQPSPLTTNQRLWYEHPFQQTMDPREAATAVPPPQPRPQAQAPTPSGDGFSWSALVEGMLGPQNLPPNTPSAAAAFDYAWLNSQAMANGGGQLMLPPNSRPSPTGINGMSGIESSMSPQNMSADDPAQP